MALAGCALLAESAAAQDLVVPAGTTLVYDTSNGRIVVQNLIVEPGAVLRAVGSLPLWVQASVSIQLDGRLDLSGFDAVGVVTLNTTQIPEPGAVGGPGGGKGGTGSPLTAQSSPRGGPGFAPPQALRRGGRGGSSGYSQTTLSPNARRPGGGGGGALAADQPLHAQPEHPANIGLIAQPGFDGAPTALGVLSQQPPPRGGAVGDRPFLDGNPFNDFFGVRVDPATGATTFGELSRPTAGSGGGGGGDAIESLVWPPVQFSPVLDEKGAGGGGGGGLGILVAPLVRLGAAGELICDGGDGGGGENNQFLDRVGGGSGGGSGGYVLIQAGLLDLSVASDHSIRAVGGRGGVGEFNTYQAMNAGGNGGPGVLALHVPNESSDILLPAGKTIAHLTSPIAHVLVPLPGL